MEGRWLSWPRHCSSGAHCSGCCDGYSCWMWSYDLCTMQTSYGMLPLGYWRVLQSFRTTDGWYKATICDSNNVTVVSTLAASYLSSSARSAGAAADLAVSASSLSFLTTLGERPTGTSGDLHEMSYLFQRLSVIVVFQFGLNTRELCFRAPHRLKDIYFL